MLPVARAAEWFHWFNANHALYPLYICPIRFTRRSPLIRTPEIALDFGVGYGVHQRRLPSTDFLHSCMTRRTRWAATCSSTPASICPASSGSTIPRMFASSTGQRYDPKERLYDIGQADAHLSPPATPNLRRPTALKTVVRSRRGSTRNARPQRWILRQRTPAACCKT